MDLIRWSTLAYTMSHDVVMLYAVVTLLHATHSRSTHGVRIPTLRRVMDASSHRSHGSPHHRIMDHGDVVDHVLSLDVPWMVLPSPWLLGIAGIRRYHRMLYCIHQHVDTALHPPPSLLRDTVWIRLWHWLVPLCEGPSITIHPPPCICISWDMPSSRVCSSW